AQTARSERSTVPRPNQFVYTRSRRQAELDKEWAPGKDGLPRVVPGVPRLWETWASVDGTRDGLQLVEPSLGYPTLVQGCPPGGSCVPQPAYRPDLPTDSTAMLAYLRSAALERSKGDPAFAQIFVYEVITGLLNGYLTPSQRGALFEAASRLPGSVVVPDVVDAAGRHGIAVAQSLLGYTEQPRPGTSPPPPAPVAQNQLIFDPTSYAYLGSRTVSTTVVDGKPAGTVTEQNAVLQTAIVDRAGQRP
ncbi:MAG: CU044_5270 family protein, partial [Micromonosporaceae bacterium]|nr:CU044_5270 family protein [Micromonosporaceae bacterium]